MKERPRSLGERPGFATRTLTVGLLLGTLAAGTMTVRSEDRTLAAAAAPGLGVEVLRPASERFAATEVREVPDFQRPSAAPDGPARAATAAPATARSRGRGASASRSSATTSRRTTRRCMKADSGRVDLEAPEVSKILEKPTLAIPHKGGKRLEADSWQYRVLRRWIEAGAKGDREPRALRAARSHARPRSSSGRDGETVPLQVVAHWADGIARGRHLHHPVPDQRRVDRRDRRRRRRDQQGEGATRTSSPSTTTASRSPRSSGRSPSRSGRTIPTCRRRRRSTS